MSVVPDCHDGTEQAWRLHSTRLKGRLIDISMNGVAFLISEQFDTEQRLLLRLSNPHFGRHVDAKARVLRTIAAENGGWKVVCRFDRKLTWEEIGAVGKHLFPSNVI